MEIEGQLLEVNMSGAIAVKGLQGLSRELDEERKVSLKRFADLIQSRSINLDDDSTFAKIVSHAVTYHRLPSSDLADAFGVNKATISRWTAGKNAPQPFARPVVVTWIRDWAIRESAGIKL